MLGKENNYHMIFLLFHLTTSFLQRVFIALGILFCQQKKKKKKKILILINEYRMKRIGLIITFFRHYFDLVCIRLFFSLQIDIKETIDIFHLKLISSWFFTMIILIQTHLFNWNKYSFNQYLTIKRYNEVGNCSLK